MSENPETAQPAAAAREPKRPRRWLRRVWRTFLVLIALLFVVRIVLFIALAPVMRKVAAAYGYDVTYDRQELTLLGGDVGLWGLQITPQSGGKPLFRSDYVRGNISKIELLKGRLFVRRAEADGVDLVIEREADGSIPVLEQILTARGTAPAAATTQPGQSDLDFTAPLLVEAFRLQRVRAQFRDSAVNPPLQGMLAMDVRVSDIGSKSRRTHFEIDIWSDPVLDSMRITGDGSSEGRNLDATASVFMRGLHPAPLAGYLEPLGIRPTGTSIGMDLKASIKTQPAAAPSRGVSATIALDDIKVTDDYQPAAALAKLRIDADAVDPQSASIASIVLEGGRLHGTRSEKGVLRVLGLDVVGASERPAKPMRAAEQGTPRSTSAPFGLTLKQIALRDMSASILDLATDPGTELKVTVTEIASTGYRDGQLPFAGKISLPGVIQTVTIEGNAKPFAEEKSLELAVRADGIRPDVLRPYLASARIESLLENGTGEARIVATIRDMVADVRISSLKLSDGQELVSMDNIDIRRVSVDPRTGVLKLGSVEVSGPAIEIARDASGRITVAKVRWTPPGAAAPAPSGAANVAPPLPSLPRVAIDNLAWKNVRVRLRDEQTQPPSLVSLDDVGIEVKDLALHLESAPANAKPGTFRAWLKAPGLARQFSAEGTVRPSANALDVQLAVRGEGIQTTTLTPYLKPLGIEPTLQDGSLNLAGKANLTRSGDVVRTTLNLADVRLNEGPTELGGIDSVQIDNLLVGSTGIEVDSVHVARPRIAVAREADAALSGLGIRFRPLSHQPAAAATSAPPATQPTAAPLPLSVVLRQLRVDDAQLGWADRMTKSPVAATGRANLQVDGLSMGRPGASPATFRATLHSEGTLDELVVSGSVDPNPDALALKAQIDGHGLRAGSMAAYLPPNIALTTRDGRVRATIDASIASNPKGGKTALLAVQNVDWRDGAEGKPLFAMESMRLSAPRVDLPADIIAIEEFSIAGVKADAQRAADGTIHAGGLALRSSPAVVQDQTAPPTTAPAVEPTQDMAALIAERRRPLPLVTLEKLDINILGASYRDLSRPQAAPIALEQTRLRNVAPIELGGAQPEGRPPLKLELTGQVSPVVRSFTVNTTLAPFAIEPTASLNVTATAIRGDGLLELVPELRPKLQSQLTDGQFRTDVEAQLKFDRRGPRDFDLSRGFQLDLLIKGISFTDGQAMLAGVESLQAEQIRVEPRTSSVLVKSVEIAKPQARIYRDADGVHALGFVARLDQLKSPGNGIVEPAATRPSESERSDAILARSTSADGRNPPTPSTRPAGEVRIDRLTISGLDVRYDDRAVTPQFAAPLNGLELEVRDLTTLALYEPRTMRFTALVNADKVNVPVYKKGATTRESEERELFSQVAATGRLVLYPQPKGYVKTAINGVELAAFEGLAALAGVELQEGTFDGNIDARFVDNGSLNTRSKLVLTDLKISEAAEGGPLSTMFKAPVDVIIPALEAPDGSITIPVNVTVKDGEISGAALASAAVGAVGSVVTTAVASAPVKVVGGATELIGMGALTGGKKDKKIPDPVVIEFSPGATYLEPAAMDQLNALLELARKDKKMQLTVQHELGTDDIALMTQRANPAAPEALAMAQQLRATKLRLSEQRSELAGGLRGQLGIAPADQTAAAVQQLRAIDQQIAEIEQSLDELYDLLRPGAERQAARRTRAASLQIAQARLDEVMSIVRASQIPGAADRVRATAARYEPSQEIRGGRIIVAVVGPKQ